MKASAEIPLAIAIKLALATSLTLHLLAIDNRLLATADAPAGFGDVPPI
jgi:hypothetical protein